jgi:serine-type D-Ala-D-Ala carboxypeptidase (penicillin-binding protein 5/6)
MAIPTSVHVFNDAILKETVRHFFSKQLLVRQISGCFIFACVVTGSTAVFAASEEPFLTAKSAVIINALNGDMIYGKNPHLPLPPASTTKMMTAILVLERLPLDQKVVISRKAANVSPSKAGLTRGAEYSVKDLLSCILVSSSNDAAVALAEAAAGSEEVFVDLMNHKAEQLGMRETRFVNATGLTDKKKNQYSTAYDLAKLMRAAGSDSRIDAIMGITTASVSGSDGRAIPIRSHNKMLWQMPYFVKGKTGWTLAARHTFIGTNYESNKRIMFALLSSERPWIDIRHLATFGLLLHSPRR